MLKREITRDEVIEKFRPALRVFEEAVVHARKMTTMKRIADLHPEIEFEAGRKRMAGQLRWWLLAEALNRRIATIPGFSVLSTEAQINGGQFVFGCPGGVFTVKRDPHDESDPDDGRYLQEAFDGLREGLELADGIDAEAPIKVYLAVTLTDARLKVCHPTLECVMTIPLADLVAPVEAMRPRSQGDPSPARARAKSARRSGAQPGKAQHNDVSDTPSS